MPEQSERIVPYFEVKINNSSLTPEQTLDVYAIDYSDELDAASMVELHVNIGNGLTGGFKWLDEDLYKAGCEVAIKMGYVDHYQEMLSGEITGLEPEFAADEALMMTVRGYSRLHRLSRDCLTRSFKEMKDSQIAAQIAQESGLSAQVEDTQSIHPYILQNNQSNFDFLLERARAIGYELAVTGKTLCFRPPPISASPELELQYGQTLLQFAPRLTTVGQFTEVETRFWDRKAKKEVVSTAKVGAEVTKMAGQTTGAAAAQSAFGKAKTVIGNLDLTSQAEAENVAKAAYNRQNLAYIAGEGLCIGTPELKAGSVVKLTGLGKRFSGVYYVTASTHSINEKGYVTSFAVRRNAA